MYQLSCQCKEGYYGQRCMETEPRTDTVINGKRHLGLEFAVKIPKTSHLEAEELYQKRVLTITGICIALLVVGIMCVVAYCKTKKQRQRLHNHLRHGMHAMNVNPPNGPHNQPQPPPSPAPAPDNSIQLRNIGASPSQYVQKNPGSDEHQLSRDTDCSFSTSHHSTTPTTSSRHNCRQCWGSGQSDESASMETNSGPLTTTGSSSRETSRPAAQCPAPRGHISAVSGPPDGRIRCDSHDLPDSPLSDRYVSAVTTPSRSSPVDILFPRHNGLLIDIPPGLRSPRPMSGSPKLWRQRGRPDLIRGGSSSSIPPSPAQFLEEEEYETTQEYEFSAPMSAPLPPTSSAPSSTNMGKGRAMRRNGKRRNGGAGIMGLGPSSTNVIMSSSTELSIGSSGGESEGESDFEIGENTPFLGIPLSLTSAGHSSFTPVGDGITFPGSAISGHSLAGPCVLPARLAYPLARATTGNGRQDSVSSVITTSQFSSEEELRMAGCTRALRDRDPIAV
uniref:Neuregulin 1 n=1 Tax=Eptatretus burgeri TaxID=7764 RepID=A0A8C4NJG3_EPTBU